MARHSVCSIARFTALLTLVFSMGCAYAVDKNSEVNIGGTRITIPEPKNFSDPSSLFPAVRKFGENMTASTNRLLGFFMSDDDVKALLAQSGPQLHRYFLVQTLRAAEAENMSERDFAVVGGQLRNQYKQLFDENAARMQSEIDTAVDRLQKEANSAQTKDINFKLGEMKVIDVMGSDTDVTLIAKTLLQVTVNGEIKHIPMVMGLTTTMVKGKIIYFFAYARLNTEEDTNWIKSQAATWLPRLFAANKSE